jgi:hypothetical protein
LAYYESDSSKNKQNFRDNSEERNVVEVTKNYFIPLVLAIGFLIAANARADVVLLSGLGGESKFTFGTNNVSGNEYTFASITYTLSDPNSVFTSFVFDAGKIDASVRAFYNNMDVPDFTFPEVDASGTYNGVFTWTGSFTVNGVTHSFGGPYSEGITGITYTPDYVPGGLPGGGVSGSYNADFSGFSVFRLDEEDLAGLNSITVAFVMTGLGFDTDFNPGAGIAQGWTGMIDGSFDVSWTSSEAAIPEPATIAVVGLGLAGLGLVRRRMKK